MATAPAHLEIPPAPASRIGSRPSLESGDRLTRAEFERRYQRRPDIRKAELVEGEVIVMSSPVSNARHGEPHAEVMGWLAVYKAATPSVHVADNTTVRLDLDNEPQPDGLLRIAKECGGQCRIDEDGYVAAGPELTAEITASSHSYDMHSKLNAYRRNLVQEYVVFLTEERRVRWFRLREGAYVELTPDAAGIVRSEIFPGLWLDVPAFLDGNLSRVLEVLQRGIASPEHAAFVAKLEQARNNERP
jgi:hypothetical protein